MVSNILYTISTNLQNIIHFNFIDDDHFIKKLKNVIDCISQFKKHISKLTMNGVLQLSSDRKKLGSLPLNKNKGSGYFVWRNIALFADRNEMDRLEHYIDSRIIRADESSDFSLIDTKNNSYPPKESYIGATHVKLQKSTSSEKIKRYINISVDLLVELFRTDLQFTFAKIEKLNDYSISCFFSKETKNALITVKAFTLEKDNGEYCFAIEIHHQRGDKCVANDVSHYIQKELTELIGSSTTILPKKTLYQCPPMSDDDVSDEDIESTLENLIENCSSERYDVKTQFVLEICKMAQRPRSQKVMIKSKKVKNLILKEYKNYFRLLLDGNLVHITAVIQLLRACHALGVEVPVIFKSDSDDMPELEEAP
jgi:hypothetical protein